MVHGQLAMEDAAVPVFLDHPCQEDTMELNPFMDVLGTRHAAVCQDTCKGAVSIAEPGPALHQPFKPSLPCEYKGNQEMLDCFVGLITSGHYEALIEVMFGGQALFCITCLLVTLNNTPFTKGHNYHFSRSQMI
jgi:hypothetical protein